MFENLRKLVDTDPRSPAQPTATPPLSVTGGLGRVPGAKHQVNTSTSPPRRAISQAEAQRLIMAEMLAAAKALTESTTELTSQIGRSGAKNGVIGLGTYQFGASGAIEINRPVTIGSAVVYNAGATTITFQAGAGAASSAPALGEGIFIVPAGALMPVPVGQRGCVLYGTNGQTVSLQLFTGLQGYGAKL